MGALQEIFHWIFSSYSLGGDKLLATALSDGTIYILNWAPGSDDPDNYDLDDGTLYTDYVDLDIPISILETISSRKEPQDFPGGTNFIKSLGYWDEIIRVTGLIAESTVSATMTKVSGWKNFFREENTDDDLYLVIKWAADTYWPFMDQTTEVQYCSGAPVREDLMFKWYHHNKFFVEVSFNWKNGF